MEEGSGVGADRHGCRAWHGTPNNQLQAAAEAAPDLERWVYLVISEYLPTTRIHHLATTVSMCQCVPTQERVSVLQAILSLAESRLETFSCSILFPSFSFLFARLFACYTMSSSVSKDQG